MSLGLKDTTKKDTKKELTIKVSKPITIDYNRFKNMILSHDVRKVVVIKNQEYVEVTLKEESLQNIDYKDELEINGLENDFSGPHYTFEITSL